MWKIVCYSKLQYTYLVTYFISTALAWKCREKNWYQHGNTPYTGYH